MIKQNEDTMHKNMDILIRMNSKLSNQTPKSSESLFILRMRPAIKAAQNHGLHSLNWCKSCQPIATL